MGDTFGSSDLYCVPRKRQVLELTILNRTISTIIGNRECSWEARVCGAFVSHRILS